MVKIARVVSIGRVVTSVSPVQDEPEEEMKSGLPRHPETAPEKRPTSVSVPGSAEP